MRLWSAGRVVTVELLQPGQSRTMVISGITSLSFATPASVIWVLLSSSRAEGAFQSGANFRDPLVDTELKNTGVFRIPGHIKTFGDSASAVSTLWFENETRGSFPKCYFSARGAVPNTVRTSVVAVAKENGAPSSASATETPAGGVPELP